MIELYPGKLISEEDAIEMIKASAEMRDAQKEFFQTRDKGVLAVAKRFEKKYDGIRAKLYGNGIKTH